MLNKGEIKIIYHAVAGVDDMLDNETIIEGFDLHNRLFNEDYFIIGRYEAEMFLQDIGGVFNAIDEVMEYENTHYGCVNTNLASAEDVANMMAYIRGEHFLGKCPTLEKNWDRKLSLNRLQEIKDELLNLL
jgi:hypothetical protein